MTAKVMPIRGGKQPIPLEPERTAIEWDSSWLAPPVHAWVEAVCANLGVPRVMAIAAALCSAATVLQGRARVLIKPGWEEPLSLYWILFSPTGTRKSALLKLATAPIRALQAEFSAETLPKQRAAKNRLASLEAQIRSARSKLKGSRLSMTPENRASHELLAELEHERDSIEIPLVTRWLYDDVNPTVVPRLMAHNLAAEGLARISVLDAEGTFLANTLGRHGNRGSAPIVEPLLKGYQGEPIDMVRTSRDSDSLVESHIDAAHCTLLLLVQPHWLDRMRESADLGENGLLGRCIVTPLAADPDWAHWHAPAIPLGIQEDYCDWIRGLHQDAEDGRFEHAIDLTVDPDVQELLRVTYEQLKAQAAKREGAQGWLARALGRICRVAVLASLGTSSKPEQSRLSQLSQPHGVCGGWGGVGTSRVSRPILEKTIFFLYSAQIASQQALEPETGPLTRTAHHTLQWLRQFNYATVHTERTLCNRLHRKKSELLPALELLEEHGFLQSTQTKTNRNKTSTSMWRQLIGKDIATDAESGAPNPDEDGR